ncbi:MAG: hypothetical protein AAGD43_03370 [Pseudomonadota bacterium]
MATFRITTPDGQEFEVEGPENMTDAQVAEAVGLYSQQQGPPGVPTGMNQQLPEGGQAPSMTDMTGRDPRPNWTGTKVEEDIRRDFINPVGQWFSQPGASIPDRIGGTAAFAGSLPVRLATQGQYGLGDLLQYVPGVSLMAPAAKEAEQAFMQRNQPGLQAAQNLGEGIGFLPSARSMGYVPPSPRVIGGMQPHERAQLAPQNPQARVSADRSRAAQYAEEAGLPTHPGIEFGPSGRQVAKVFEQQPVIGEPLRAATRNMLDETRKRTEGIASQYGTAENLPAAGNIARGAVERFRREQPEIDIERLDDENLRLIVDEPAARTSLPVAAAARYELAWRIIPKKMREGASVKTLPRVMGGVAETSREVQRIIGRNTGIINREAALRERSLNYDPTAAQVRDPTLPSIGEMTSLRGDRSGNFPQAAVPAVGNKLVNHALLDIALGVWRGTAQDIRNLRSEIRRQIASLEDNERNVASLADLNRLHHTLGEDFYRLLKRNAADYRNRKDEVNARKFEMSIDRFKQADEFYQRAQEDVSRLRQFTFDTMTAERAGNAIYRAALDGGKGNIELVRSLRRTVQPEEWNEIASAMIREMGSVPPGQPGFTGDINFSLTRFATDWKRLSPQSRVTLFGDRDKRAAFKEINEMANLATQFREFEALANTSRSGVHNLTAGLLTGSAAGLYYYPVTTLSVAALGYSGSLAMSNTRFLRWMNQGRRFEARAYRGNVSAQRALANHMVRLNDLIRQDPNTLALFQSLHQQTAESEAR